MNAQDVAGAFPDYQIFTWLHCALHALRNTLQTNHCMPARGRGRLRRTSTDTRRNSWQESGQW